MENLLKNKIKDICNFSFNKILIYSNSDFILKFSEFKNKTFDFINNHSILMNNNNENMNNINNEVLIYNSYKIHNFLEMLLLNLKEKLNLSTSNIICSNIDNFRENQIDNENYYENMEYSEKSEKESQEHSQEFIPENEFNFSAISEDCLFEYENVKKNTKNNSYLLGFQNISIKRERAMSENDESLNFLNTLKNLKEKEPSELNNNLPINNKHFSNFDKSKISNDISETFHDDNNSYYKNLNNFEKFGKINPKNSLKNIGFEIEFNGRCYNDTNPSSVNSFRRKNFEIRFNRLNKKIRLSSEEMQKRINEKLEQAEKNKNDLKKFHTENHNRTMMKIKDIKNKKKIEKLEKMQKLYKKIEKFNQRHQDYLNEKLSKAKSENEKISEIKFLLKIDKENKNLNLLKKLDISTDRRKKYIEQKLWKTKLRNKREEILLKTSNKISRDDSSNTNFTNSLVDDEIKAKFLNKIKKDLKNEINMTNQIDNAKDYDSVENKNCKNEFNKTDKNKLKNNSNYDPNQINHTENCPFYKMKKSLSKNKNSTAINTNNINNTNTNSINNRNNNNNNNTSNTNNSNNKNNRNDENIITCKCNDNIKENSTNEKSNRIIFNQKKQKLEENFEFIRAIYSENFIWELLEADYFDIEELCELSHLTKFELLKSKLKKDKEKIDKLFENKNFKNTNLKNDLIKNLNNNFSNINIFNNLNSKISNINNDEIGNLNNFNNNNFSSNGNLNLINNNSINNVNANNNNVNNNNNNVNNNSKKQNTVYTDSLNSFFNESEKNYFNFEEQILANDSDEKDSFYLENQKKSRSFMHFDENDFIDYEYLFNDSTTKKNKKKKKKKIANNNNNTLEKNVNTDAVDESNNLDSNSANNDDTEKIKNKLIKTISSLSQKTISTLYKSINNEDKKMKKYLVKSKNGKYLKSKILIKNEDSENENKNAIKVNNNNNNLNFNKTINLKNKDKENSELSRVKKNSFKQKKSSNNLVSVSPLINSFGNHKIQETTDNEKTAAHNNEKSNFDREINQSIYNNNLLNSKEKYSLENSDGKTKCTSHCDNENDNNAELENIDVKENEMNNKIIEEQEKLIKDIVSNNDITNILENNNSKGNKTLMINSELVSKIIEKNALYVKWCKLCNVIVKNLNF